MPQGPRGGSRCTPGQAGLRETRRVPGAVGQALPLERLSQQGTFRKVLSSRLVTWHPRPASVSRYLVTCPPCASSLRTRGAGGRAWAPADVLCPGQRRPIHLLT